MMSVYPFSVSFHVIFPLSGQHYVLPQAEQRLTCGQQKESLDRQSQLNLYQFFCWLHVSAFVKSHHQAFKNTKREII
jgi:hypothetical protein